MAQLDELKRRHSELVQRIQRITGRREEAQRSLEKLEQSLLEKGIDPESLDDHIEETSRQLAEKLRQVDEDLTLAERELKDIAEKAAQETA